MNHSDNAIALVKQFEGCRLEAYQDQGGVWTIGYGHTLGVTQGMAISQESADGFLESDLEVAENCVNTLVTVALTQNQFDAICDFVFNLGCGHLQSSTLLRLLNQGFTGLVPAQFMRWVFAGGKVSAGLVARREAERELFETP